MALFIQKRCKSVGGLQRGQRRKTLHIAGHAAFRESQPSQSCERAQAAHVALHLHFLKK